MEENKIEVDESSKLLLERIYQGCKSNVYVLKQIINKTVNENYKNQLEKNSNEFLKVLNECLAVASTFNVNLMDINLLKKTKLKATIKFNSFVDDSTQNTTKMILTLFNEEIYSVIKALDCTPNCVENVKTITLKYNKALEKSINDTKKYLLNDPSKFNEITKNKKQEDNSKKKKSKKNKKDKEATQK